MLLFQKTSLVCKFCAGRDLGCLGYHYISGQAVVVKRCSINIYWVLKLWLLKFELKCIPLVSLFWIMTPLSFIGRVQSSSTLNFSSFFLIQKWIYVLASSHACASPFFFPALFQPLPHPVTYIRVNRGTLVSYWQYRHLPLTRPGASTHFFCKGPIVNILTFWVQMLNLT